MNRQLITDVCVSHSNSPPRIVALLNDRLSLAMDYSLRQSKWRDHRHVVVSYIINEGRIKGPENNLAENYQSLAWRMVETGHHGYFGYKGK